MADKYTETFGVAFTERTHEQIIQPLGHQDSRSERIRCLVKDGLAIEEAVNRVENEYDVTLSGRGKRGFVRQAIIDQADDEFGVDDQSE